MKYSAKAKFLLALAGALFCLQPALALEMGDPKGQTITFWHSMGGVNGDALNSLVAQFNAENELGITVDVQYQGSYDDAINKLRSAQLGNMGTDLVQIYDIGSRFMIDSGWVVAMQDLIDAAGYDMAQLEPNIAAYYTIGDKLYSMPFNSSTPLLYYNVDMFKRAGIDKIPESFDDILAIGEKLKADGGAGEVLTVGIYGWFFEQWVSKQGLHYADNGNGREGLATAVAFDENGAGLAILNAWKSLADAGMAPNVGRGGEAGVPDFSAGRSAMTLESTATLKQILQEVGGKFEVGAAFFPKIHDDDVGGVSVGGGSLWALDNGDADKLAATWELVKFLISPAAQAYWNANTGYFPVTVAAHDEPVFKDNLAVYPQFQVAIDQLHATSPAYVGALLSVFPEARQTVESEIENMLNNRKTPEQSLASMVRSINSAIEEYNLLNE